MKKFNEIKALIASLEDDVTKFYSKNNNAAGTRVRKGMMDLKKLAQDVRTEVQDMKNREEVKK
jgi:gas vesicle protein